MALGESFEVLLQSSNFNENNLNLKLKKKKYFSSSESTFSSSVDSDTFDDSSFDEISEESESEVTSDLESNESSVSELSEETPGIIHRKPIFQSIKSKPITIEGENAKRKRVFVFGQDDNSTFEIIRVVQWNMTHRTTFEVLKINLV